MRLFAAFRRRVTSRRRRRLAAPDWVEPTLLPEADDDAGSTACGWFDSSWALRAGLSITEHASVDPVANDLPLGWWLYGPGAASPSRPR